jgi:tetratricopeptide (TPR) repeat protein
MFFFFSKEHKDEAAALKAVEKAIKYNQEAAKLQPENPEPYENMASCYIALNKVLFSCFQSVKYFVEKTKSNVHISHSFKNCNNR